MAKRAQLPDGTILEFPDETPDAVMDKAVRSHLGAAPAAQEAPAQPPRVPLHSDVLAKAGLLPEGLRMPVRNVENALRGARQGATFGFSDELVGARDAFGALVTGGDPRQAYRQSRDLERSRMAQFARDEPAANFSANLGGGLLTGTAPAKAVAAAPSLLGSVARSVPTGIGYGALSGLGVGEGDALEQLISTGKGALIGGIAAPVITAGIGGASALSRLIPRKPVTHTVNAPPSAPQQPSAAPQGAPQRLTETAPTRPTEVTARNRAMDLVAETMRRSGVKPVDILEQLRRNQGAKPEMFVDYLGDQGARRLYSTRTLGGPASSEAVEKLATRGEGTAARVSADVQRATAQRGQSLTQLAEGIENRRRTGNLLYQEAYRHGQITNPETLTLIQNPRVAEILKKASDRRSQVGDLRGEPYQPLFRQGEQGPVLARAPTVEDLHLLKTSLDDDIRQAQQAGEGQLAGALRSFKDRIVRNLEDEVPAYRKARETYKGDIEIEEAIANGRNDILRKPVDELQRDFAALSGAERDAYRSGAIDTILARKVDPKADSADFARSLWGNADSRNRLKLLVRDENELVRLAHQFEREKRMALTNRSVLGGSPTAMRNVDIEDQVAGSLADVATQGPTGAFVSTVGRWIRRAGGVTEAVADDVANLLTAESPETIRAVLGSLQGREQQRVLQAMRQQQAARGGAATAAQQ